MSLSSGASKSDPEMRTILTGRRVGYWLSEKKTKKMNFPVFVDMCRKQGLEMVQLDLNRSLEDQGPLDVILHKLTDLIPEAYQNDTKPLLWVRILQNYMEAHPETVVLDPLPAIMTLLDRCKSYQLIRRLEECMKDDRICSPPFMVLRGDCGTDTLQNIKKHGITFPFICKTPNSNSHEMAIIFSEEDLKDVKPPCVIQNFINHNAVLYKVYVVGDSYTVVERPSIRNFPTGPVGRKSIFFHSHNVSKPECSSDLNSRDNVEGVSRTPNDDVIREITRCLRQALDVSLFGIDIIICNQTGQHAVIDINAFPGYAGVPEFFNDLLSHLNSVLLEKASGRTCVVGGQPASAAVAHCGKPGLIQEQGANAWIVEGECVKRVGSQGEECTTEVSVNFQNHCGSSTNCKASSQ